MFKKKVKRSSGARMASLVFSCYTMLDTYIFYCKRNWINPLFYLFWILCTWTEKNHVQQLQNLVFVITANTVTGLLHSHFVVSHAPHRLRTWSSRFSKKTRSWGRRQSTSSCNCSPCWPRPKIAWSKILFLTWLSTPSAERRRQTGSLVGRRKCVLQ